MRSKHNVKPFKIDMPEARLEDPMARLKRTRVADGFGNDGWRCGCNTAYRRERADYRTNE